MIADLEGHVRWSAVRSEAVYLSPPDRHEVIETKPGGKGCITFIDARTALAAKPVNDNMPLLWIDNDECADGAFVVEDGDGLHINLVELKSKVNAGKWTTARLQFEGMLTNVLAILGFLEVLRPVRITCYLALKTESISRSERANPIYAKHLIGVPQRATGERLSATDQFRRQMIDILHYRDVQVRLMWRDAAGNAQGAFI